MNFVRNSIVIFLSLVSGVLGLFLLDYHQNGRLNDGHFFTPLFLEGFLVNYLGVIDNAGYSQSQLYFEDCEHVESTDGKIYLPQYQIINDYSGYRDTSPFWFFNREDVVRTPELFEVYTGSFSPEGADINFRVNNYTLHRYELFLEKKGDNGWARLPSEVLWVDSFVNGMADVLRFQYYDQNRDQHKVSYEGTAVKYKFQGEQLKIGEYRIFAKLEEHEPNSCYFEIVAKIPVEEFVTKEELTQSDSVHYLFRNASGATLYYAAWDTLDHLRIRDNLRVFRDGVAQEQPFGGFGCATGVYAQPLAPNTTVSMHERNPLLYWLYPTMDDVPSLLDSLYGDSVGVTFFLYTYSPFWSRYKPQYIYTEEIMVNTSELIHNWRKRHGDGPSEASL